MAMVEIDAAKLAQLKTDAKLTRSIRKARTHGATVMVIQPLQSLRITIDQLTPEDREAIKAALNAALTSA